ncbi:MAG: hypothetical protein ACR2LR_06080 [Hassallia sp.]
MRYSFVLQRVLRELLQLIMETRGQGGIIPSPMTAGAIAAGKPVQRTASPIPYLCLC